MVGLRLQHDLEVGQGIGRTLRRQEELREMDTEHGVLRIGRAGRLDRTHQLWVWFHYPGIVVLPGEVAASTDASRRVGPPPVNRSRTVVHAQ